MFVHVLQMNDVMLYTYPQQDGKYRLKNTLTLSGMKVRQQRLSARSFWFLVNLQLYYQELNCMCFHVSVGQQTCHRRCAQHAQDRSQRCYYHSLSEVMSISIMVCMCLSVLPSTVMQSLQAWLFSASGSSLGEREDWFHTLSRAIADHAAGLNTFSCSSEVWGNTSHSLCTKYLWASYQTSNRKKSLLSFCLMH